MSAPEAEYTAFYEQHHDRLVRWVAGQVGAGDAEDVAAKALLAVWQRWEDLEDPAGYLYGAAKNSIRTEWKDRARRPAAVGELPDWQPMYGYGYGDFQDDLRGTAATVAWDWFDNGGTASSAVVAGALAEGYDRHRVAELTGLPKAEVDKAVRQLRKYYRQRGTGPQDDGLVREDSAASAERALRRLPRRQREVFALAVLGLRPVQIAGLLGINSTDARVNLCYARKAISKALPDLVAGRSADEAMAGVPMTTVMELLPNTGWKRDALAVYAAPDEWMTMLMWLAFAGVIENRPTGDDTSRWARSARNWRSCLEALAPRLSGAGLPAEETVQTVLKWGGYDQIRLVDSCTAGSDRYPAPRLEDLQHLGTRPSEVELHQVKHGRPAREERRVREYLAAVAKVFAVVRNGLDEAAAIATPIGGPRYRTAPASGERSGPYWLPTPDGPMPGMFDAVGEAGVPDNSGYNCPVPAWTPVRRTGAAKAGTKTLVGAEPQAIVLPSSQVKLINLMDRRRGQPAELKVRLSQTRRLYVPVAA